MKFTKKTIYIGLFAILYLIVAFSSFWHACAFFGLANNSWMSIILAFAFEVGQAAVLFSLLTSKKDRSRVMPWVLMTMFTLVQVIGNVFSSYKYLITNSVENLRFFKEPIFIWTDLPDDQATVIITYVVGAILPVAALLLTSMITNYLTDNEEQITPNVDVKENIIVPEITSEKGPNEPIEFKDEKEFIDIYNGEKSGIKIGENKSNNDTGEQSMDTIESEESSESTITEDSNREDNEISTDSNTGTSGESEGSESRLDEDKSGNRTDDLEDNIPEPTDEDVIQEAEKDLQEEKQLKDSHFINLK